MLKDGCNKEDCIYRSINHGQFISCDYLLNTNQLRGCEIGDKCDKYTPGEKHHDWMKSLKYIQKKY